MASLEIRPELDELLRDVAGSFTPDSLKQVIQSTKKTLGGKFESLPNDNLYPLLRRLRQEGHITDDNVTMLDKVFASQTTKQEAIAEKINVYKGLGFHKKGLVVEATGRTEEISEILRRFSSDEIHVLNMYGSGGVGKTTVAKQIHSQWRGKHFMVDLREVTSMGVLHFKVLQIFEPSTTTISYEAKPVMDRIQQVVEDAKDPVLLTLDNVEQFITKKNDLKMHFVGFLSRLSEIERLKVLLTSRCEVGDTKVVNDFCLQPLQSDSSQELLQSMAEVHLDVDKRERLVKHCRGKPLFLKGMASVLRQEIEKAEDLLSRIEKEAGEKPEKSTKPEGQEPAQAQEGSKEEIESGDLIVLKEMFSNISSKELKDAALAISLFRLPFTASSAAAVLDVPIEKAFLLLESLRKNGIINVSDPDAKELLYDIHPLMLSFVSSIKNEPEFKEKYEAAEKIFCTIFIKKMTNLSSMLDANYLAAHKQFQAERANFELVLEMSFRESNYVHQLLSTEYHKNSMVYFLFEAMLTHPDERKKLFHSWAESVEADHEGILSANLRCWEALQTLNSEGTHSAFEVLKKAKSSLGKVKQEERGSKEYQLTQGLYLFGEGEMYLKRGQPRVALEKLFSSLETRKKLLGAHGETAKCFNSIGNCFCELDKLTDALEYYKKAYEMREKLTGSENHFEMPVYKNQMGGVEERMKNYVKAIELYESALELEKKLELMTYANTAIFKRNIANACMWEGNYNKAFKPAKEAYQIRREFLGNNPDTVRSAYQMGLIYREKEDPMRALKFLREAWEMEKVLQKGNHSPVRDRIPTDILYCLRKEEKAAFKADMLKFYRRIWEEEKSFEAFQPSPPNQAIIDKIMQLVSDRQANEDVDLREKYEEEALWYYARAWEAEVGFFDELKREDRPEKQQEMVFKRDQILDRILYLCGELDKEEASKKYEEVQKKFKYKLLKTEEFQGRGRYSREKLQQALGDAPPPDLSDEEDEKSDSDDSQHQEDPSLKLQQALGDDEEDEKSDSDDSQQQEGPSLKHTEVFEVGPEGAKWDVPKASVHFIFPAGAVTQQTEVTCSMWDPTFRAPTFDKNETLVSNVIELSSAELQFSNPVSIVLPYSSTELGGYEVVIKQLTDQMTWEEIETTDIKDESDIKDDYPSIEEIPEFFYPVAEAQITEGSTFAVVSRLASHEFPVTNKGNTWTHPDYPKLNVIIPRGTISVRDKQMNVTVKVQGVPVHRFKEVQVHPAPILYITASKDVTFLKPVTLKIPMSLQECYGTDSPDLTLDRARVLFLKSEDSEDEEVQWMDITDEVAGSLQFEDNVVTFQVKHFSGFSFMWDLAERPVTSLGSGVSAVFDLMRSIYQFGGRAMRALFIEGMTEPMLNSRNPLKTLHLYLCPEHQRSQVFEEIRNLLSSASLHFRRSFREMQPREEAFVTLLDQGRPVPTENVVLRYEAADFCQESLDFSVRVQTYTLQFFSDNDGSKLCEFPINFPSVEPNQAERQPPDPVQFFGVLLEDIDSGPCPYDVVWCCRRHLGYAYHAMPVVIERTKWDYPGGKASFFRVLARLVPAQLQNECLSEILDRLRRYEFVQEAERLSRGRQLVNQPPNDAAVEFVSSSRANLQWQDLAAELNVDPDLVFRIAPMQEHNDVLCRHLLAEWRNGEGAVLKQLLEALTDIGLGEVTIELCRTQLQR